MPAKQSEISRTLIMQDLAIQMSVYRNLLPTASDSFPNRLSSYFTIFRWLEFTLLVFAKHDGPLVIIAVFFSWSFCS
jgi:hypothetical protein